MRIRIPVSLAALLFAFSLSAQSNEVGVFFNAPSFSSTSTTDPDIGRIKLPFDGKTGYGISLDHFTSPDTALHISAQKLRADSRLEFPDQGVSFDAGTLDLTEYTAALHWYFLSRNMVRPYAGAGIARIQSVKLHIPAELSESGTAAETVSLDSKTTWTADAGIDIHIGANAAITLSAQYTPYKTHFGAAPDDPVQYVKLNPVVFAGGLRWRF
jgi:outer membrane protein W